MRECSRGRLNRKFTAKKMHLVTAVSEPLGGAVQDSLGASPKVEAFVD